VHHLQETHNYMASGAVIAMIVEKRDVFNELARVIGNRDPAIAQQIDTDCLRAGYGESVVRNAIEFAATKEIFAHNVPTFFFQAQIMNEVRHSITKSDANAQPPAEKEEKEEKEEKDEDTDTDSGHIRDDRNETLVMVKPHVSTHQIEAIQDFFNEFDIKIVQQKAMHVPQESLREILQTEYSNKRVIELMLQRMRNEEVLVWIVTSTKPNADIFEQLPPIMADIRLQFGKSAFEDVLHCSTSRETATLCH
jgi:nucleoside diphosphate kinase